MLRAFFDAYVNSVSYLHLHVRNVFYKAENWKVNNNKGSIKRNGTGCGLRVNECDVYVYVDCGKFGTQIIKKDMHIRPATEYHLSNGEHTMKHFGVFCYIYFVLLSSRISALRYTSSPSLHITRPNGTKPN